MDLYGLQMSGLPPEYQAQLRKSQQQQMIAQSLLDQSQDPIGQQQPGVAISPFQGLAKVAQAYAGAKALQQGNDAYAKIGEKYTADQSAAIEKVKSALVKPATPIPLIGADGVAGTNVDRPVAEQRTALVDAAMSQFPGVQRFAMGRDAQLDRQESREDTQRHQEQQAQLARDQRAHELELARQAAAQAQLQQFQHQKEMKEAVARNGAQPFFQFLPGENGYLVGNARTGQMTPAMVNGQPAIKASDSPTLQGKIAGAKTGGEAVAKREFNMTGLGGAINEARSILNGELRHCSIN